MPEEDAPPSPWPANARFGPGGLEIAGVAAAGLADEFGTPLFVIDEADFRARSRAFAEAFPRVLYAVKAFTSGHLIRLAAREGLGFLASTGGELQACLRAGARAGDIALHGNTKADEEISMAVDAGVGLITADHLEELDRIDQAAAAAGRVQPVLLRVMPGISGETHAYLDTGGLDSKFGTPIGDGRALTAIERAAELEHLAFEGVHAHIGSQLLDPEPFIAEIDALFGLLADAATRGIAARILDVGGGFGVTYTDERPESPEAMAAAMLERVHAAATERGLPVPGVVVEPGRALIANPVLTLYRVGTIKDDGLGRRLVAVDGGMSDNMRPALYDARYTVAAAGAPRADVATSPATIVGRHCESGDVLARDVALRSDLRPGTLLAFAATGAYGYAMANNYNRVGRPAVVAVHDGAAQLIFRREDDADLDRLEVAVPPDPAGDAPAGIEIRPARPKDAASFHEMWSAVTAEGTVRSREPAQSARSYKTLFRDSWNTRGAWIVAAEPERIVGLISLTREEHEAVQHVASLGISVDASWRGRGVGTALMAAGLGWAREFGIAKLILGVYPDNAPAIRLYRRFGFVDEGRLVNQSRKQYGYQDEVMMARWLT